MSEQAERLDTGEESSATGVDPAAVALALAGASREDANAFLEKQGRLVDLQCEYMASKDKFELSHLRWRRFTEQMKGTLQFLTAIVGIAVASAFGLMVWDAAHSSGLIIAPFTVPDDMAVRGLTGQAIASRMLDKINAMDGVYGFTRSPHSYENNWSSGIKVQIPETGVSIGEFRQFLRDWLGHDTQISGEVYHTDTGIVVTARTSGQTGGSFAGPPSDLDSLIQKAAEHVYGNTQVARYAWFLNTNGRTAEGVPVFRRLTDDPSRLERAWAWDGLALIPRGQYDFGAALWYLRKAISVFPDFVPAHHLSAWFERILGHPGVALEEYRKTKALLNQSEASQFDSRYVPKFRLDTDLYVAFLAGDYAQAINLGRSGEDVADALGSEVTFDSLRNAVAISFALQHDGTNARAFFSQMPEPAGGSRNSINFNTIWRGITRVRMDAALQDWSAVTAADAATEKTAIDLCPTCENAKVFRVQLRPWVALAKARTGGIAGAQALIAASPDDCYDCNLIRGEIAEAAKQPGQADTWFAKAVHDAPSIPIAYAQWGEALVARGKPDDAIEKFTLANQKGPHFADPLEGWGEALMAENQSHLALAKFAEAEKYAPNWGRLHLKWGEALYYAGKKDEAKTQFARAAQLDLTPSEKSELAKAASHA
jgi:Tfp pilus assembly protein PilF